MFLVYMLSESYNSLIFLHYIFMFEDACIVFQVVNVLIDIFIVSLMGVFLTEPGHTA